MDLAWYMTDVLGPRLTGSPGLRRAQQWAKSTMEASGLVNATIEPYGEHGVGWTNQYTSLHLLEPTYQPLIGDSVRTPWRRSNGSPSRRNSKPVANRRSGTT